MKKAKPNMYNYLRLLIMFILSIVVTVLLLNYFTDKKPITLIIAITTFITIIVVHGKLTIKVKKEIIKRDEQIRIAARQEIEKE